MRYNKRKILMKYNKKQGKASISAANHTQLRLTIPMLEFITWYLMFTSHKGMVSSPNAIDFP
jgi:hypothetical protein